MNARHAPFGALLAADYSHHGISLDLYGKLTADGYEVEHVLIAGTHVPMTDCVSGEALDAMGAALDDTLPTSEQLRKASALEARADIVKWNLDMSTVGWAGMS